MKNFLISLVLVFVAAFAMGQAPAPPDKDKRKVAPGTAQTAPTLPPGVTISEPSYLFPVEERIKIRDLQVEYDELEIDNQRMLLKVEQNKARQAAAMDAIRLAAWQFAQAKKISTELYELDPKKIEFVKKKVK
jgi:TolA-binding protein